MFRRRRSAEDFSEEIKAHLDLEADALRSEGLSESEAHRRAQVEFGNREIARERFKLKYRMVWLDGLARDAIGGVCSLGAATLMQKLLFGVRTWDIPTLAAVAAVLGVAALASSFIPAHRAASVNPVDALRAE